MLSSCIEYSAEAKLFYYTDTKSQQKRLIPCHPKAADLSWIDFIVLTPDTIAQRKKGQVDENPGGYRGGAARRYEAVARKKRGLDYLVEPMEVARRRHLAWLRCMSYPYPARRAANEPPPSSGCTAVESAGLLRAMDVKDVESLYCSVTTEEHRGGMRNDWFGPELSRKSSSSAKHCLSGRVSDGFKLCQQKPDSRQDRSALAVANYQLAHLVHNLHMPYHIKEFTYLPEAELLQLVVQCKQLLGIDTDTEDLSRLHHSVPVLLNYLCCTAPYNNGTARFVAASLPVATQDKSAAAVIPLVLKCDNAYTLVILNNKLISAELAECMQDMFMASCDSRDPPQVLVMTVSQPTRSRDNILQCAKTVWRME